MADIFDLGKYPLIPLAIGERSIYELGTDFGYDDCLAVGALDSIFDKSTPLANRVPAPGDFLDIAFREEPAGLVRFYISYDSSLDTYTLLPCSMGNRGAPIPPVSGGIIAIGNVTWAGSGQSYQVSVPGMLTTDLVYPVIRSYGSSTGVVTVNPVDLPGGGGFLAYLNAAETTNSLIFSYMVIRPAT